MTILISGATGTIGSQLARELLDRGASVRAASRNPETLAALAERGAETARLDLEDPSTFAAAFEGVDAAFIVGPQNDPEFGSRLGPVVEAAAAAGVGHLLRYSALGADPDAEILLARQHGVAEAQVKGGSVPWTILRPTFYQDNLVNFSGETIREQGTFYGASGDGAAAYISSADIARAAAAILMNPAPHAGATYVLTGREALTAPELAALATEILGREIRYVDLPQEQIAAAMKEAGLPEWIAESLAALEGVKRAGYAAETTGVVAELTGREPERYREFLDRNRGKLA